MQLSDIVTAVMQRQGPVRLVAVDGPGGAGKTTFAAKFAAAADGAPVVHTDDFASHDNPKDWWPRLRAEVIEPLSRNEPATYQRYDWDSRSLAEWTTIEPTPIVIVEGVSAARLEWSEYLAYVIWIETPQAERLRRVNQRDGSDPDDTDDWMAAENEHYRRDRSRERADLIIDGTHS